MRYTYAGIGSRETPPEICSTMTEVAKKLGSLGYTLYSGGANGADNAFELGSPRKAIFLPWDGFAGRYADGNSFIVPPYREDIVKLYHPAGDRLKPGALKLMSRNSYQVLGPDLKSPVDFVVCWTKDGKASGGTGQAIRIADSIGIPVFNLKRPNDLTLLEHYITMSNIWR